MLVGKFQTLQVLLFVSLIIFFLLVGVILDVIQIVVFNHLFDLLYHRFGKHGLIQEINKCMHVIRSKHVMRYFGIHRHSKS